MVLVRSTEIAVPTPGGPGQPVIENSGAPVAPFLYAEQAAPTITGVKREATVGDNEVARFALSARIILSLSPEAATSPTGIVKKASWRDKYLLAAVLRECDPNIRFPLPQRVSAYLSSLIFKR